MFQEKGSGAILFQEKGSGTLQTAVLKEKETGALLLMFLGEGICYTTDYSCQREGNWCSTAHVFRRSGLVLTALLFSREGRWGCTYQFLTVLSI